jgi:competence protein ComEA
MLLVLVLAVWLPVPAECASKSQYIILLPININTADELTLSRALVGIGPHKATAIVEYRQLHGPFLQPEDLIKVKGVGKGTLKKNRGRISIR